MKIIEPPAEENLIKSFTPQGEVYSTSRKEEDTHAYQKRKHGYG